MQDNLSFPLICADWNADEEILLLEVRASALVSNYYIIYQKEMFIIGILDFEPKHNSFAIFLFLHY